MAEPFKIVLNDLRRLPQFSIVVSQLARVFTTIAKEAGRTLSLEHGAILPDNRVSGDLALDFEYEPPLKYDKLPDSPSGAVEFFGNTDGSIFVYAMREFRMGGGPRPYSVKTGIRGTDYYSQIQRVLNTDELVAKAAANTTVHELGHMIAKLDHTSNPTNFMYAGRAAGTLSARQAELAGWKAFTSEQTKKLVAAIRTRKMGDEMKTRELQTK